MPESWISRTRARCKSQRSLLLQRLQVTDRMSAKERALLPLAFEGARSAPFHDDGGCACGAAGALTPVRERAYSTAMPSPAIIHRLHSMITGGWIAASLHTAAVLGIAELLAGGPRTAHALAGSTGTDPDALRRLLRMLATHGVFAECEDGSFAQTESSTLLCADAPGSLRAMLLMYGSDVWRKPWDQMLHAIRTGETAFSKVHGAEVFEYMQRDDEFAAIFNQAMTEGSARLAAGIVAAYDFSRFTVVIDVGGGQGWLLSAILRATPAARGILVDLPHVIESARPLLEQRGVADRCELVGSSFFESVPAGGDAYVMKWILHDWNDAKATQILRVVRAAIPPGGRLVVFDRVLPERVMDGEPAYQSNTLADLNMLVNVTGRERTEAEFRALLTAGGFALSSARSLPSGLGIVEGVPT